MTKNNGLTNNVFSISYVFSIVLARYRVNYIYKLIKCQEEIDLCVFVCVFAISMFVAVSSFKILQKK